MKKLYRFFLLALSVLLLLGSMTGCGGSASSGTPAGTEAPPIAETEPAVETETPITETPVTEAAAPETEAPQEEEIIWVIPDHLKVGYTNSFAWTCAEGIDWNVSISLPALTCAEDFADEFNATMEEYFTRMSSYFQDHMDRGDDPHVVSISFEANRNDHLLSVIIIEEMVDGNMTYVAYNYDLVNHRELSIAEVCDEYLDLDYTQFLSATDQLIMEDFDKLFAHLLEKEPEFYEFIRQLTFSDITSVSARNLYLAEDGTVMLIYHAPTENGALEEHTVLPFSHHKYDIPSEADAYHWLLNIAATLDDEHRDGYIQILREAFTDDAEDFSEALAKLPQDHIATIIELLVSGYQDDPDLLRRIANDEVEIPAIRDAILAAIG